MVDVIQSSHLSAEPRYGGVGKKKKKGYHLLGFFCIEVENTIFVLTIDLKKNIA